MATMIPGLGRALLAAAMAVTALQARAAGLAGTWSGSLQGQRARAELVSQQDTLSGTLDVSGYVYRIRARQQGQAAQGEMTDQEGQSVPVSLQADGDRLTMRVQAVPGVAAATLEIHLLRGAGRAGAEAPPAAAQADPWGGGDAVPAGPGGVDPVLIGTWSRVESYHSGDFSIANQQVITLFADGTYRFGGGRMVGGGDAGTLEGQSGGGDSGRWSAHNRLLYVFEPGIGWQPYARYHVEGSKVMVTFGDGTREIWNRAY